MQSPTYDHIALRNWLIESFLKKLAWCLAYRVPSSLTRSTYAFSFTCLWYPIDVQEDEEIKHHNLQPGDYAYWKRDLQDSLQLKNGKDHIYQVLLTNLCAANFKVVALGFIFFLLKKALAPIWTAKSTEYLKLKITGKWSWQHLLWAANPSFWARLVQFSSFLSHKQYERPSTHCNSYCFLYP